jgi:hypothetical protein
MSLPLKRASWLIAILAGIAALSVAFLNHPGKEGTLAASVESPGDATPVSGCANTACNDACWADGSHSNIGTFAKHTIPQPPGCGDGGGCVTMSCGPCENTACNDACWEDGTHSNPGTFAKKTLITPSGCEGVGGCVTISCF